MDARGEREICAFARRCLSLFFDSVLLTWVLSNALLAATITITNAKAANGNGGANKAVNGYMAFLLASVAGLACRCLFDF